MTFLDNFFKYIGLVAIFSAFAFITFVFISLNTEPEVIEVKQPMRLLKKEYKVGEILTYEIDYCKKKNYQVISFERALVDGYTYRLPDTTNNSVLPVGCGVTKIDVPLIVPNNISTDYKYRIVVTITYQINFFRTKVSQFQTEEFTLKK